MVFLQSVCRSFATWLVKKPFTRVSWTGHCPANIMLHRSVFRLSSSRLCCGFGHLRYFSRVRFGLSSTGAVAVGYFETAQRSQLSAPSRDAERRCGDERRCALSGVHQPCSVADWFDTVSSCSSCGDPRTASSHDVERSCSQQSSRQQWSQWRWCFYG